jgi:hypothetical protein
MTDKDWCRATERELEMILGVLSPRKQRLFAVAVCRELVSRIKVSKLNKAIEAIESYAETKISRVALNRKVASLRASLDDLMQDHNDQQNDLESVEFLVMRTVLAATTENAVRATFRSAERAIDLLPGTPTDEVRRPFLPAIRDFFGFIKEPFSINSLLNVRRSLDAGKGNPIVQKKLAPGQATTTATAIAQQIYDSRDFSAMPILADALQDAGCEDATILDHCRGPGPHWRGCWAVDLVLGKR